MSDGPAVSKKQTGKAADEVSYGGVPRVNLMPPEVAQLRAFKSQRRTLLSLFVFVAVVAIAGVVAATLYAADAQRGLDAERSQTEALVLEQAEYAEAVGVLGELADIAEQRAQLAAVEVLWRDVLTPYVAVIGDSAEITAVSVASATPAQARLPLQGPLRSQPVATMTLTVVSEGFPEAPSWLRGFAELDTFGDGSIDSIVGTAEEGYTTTMLVNIAETALSGRFEEED